MKASNFFTGCFFAGCFFQPADDASLAYFSGWALTLILFAAWAIACRKWEEEKEKNT